MGRIVRPVGKESTMRKGAVGEAAGIVFADATQAARALGRAAAFCVGLAAIVAVVVVLVTLVAVMVVAAIVPAHGPKRRIRATRRSVRPPASRLVSVDSKNLAAEGGERTHASAGLRV